MPNVDQICPRCGHELGWAFDNWRWLENRGIGEHISCPSGIYKGDMLTLRGLGKWDGDWLVANVGTDGALTLKRNVHQSNEPDSSTPEPRIASN